MTFAPTLVTPSDFMAMTLDEAKAQLVIDHDDDNDLITSLIATAQQHLDGPDGILSFTLFDSVWEEVIDFGGATSSALKQMPVSEIVSVTVDGEPVTGTISLRFRDCGTAVVILPNAIQGEAVVRYRAGARADGDEAPAIPAPLKHAMKLHVASLYENREMEVTGTIVSTLPHYKALTDPFRRRRIG